jgi:hypothetical protein
MTYCPNSDENWETLSAQEAGFDQARGARIQLCRGRRRHQHHMD